MTLREWDPNEWQKHCELLLATHYEVRVQLIPDRDRGDGGLEAYVADEETAFQCYAPEEPFSLDAQTRSQKQKIAEDTKKLIDHDARTCSLIGRGRRIKTWVLMTPAYESKELVTYANTRSLKVRVDGASSGWCHPDFRIVVADDSLFPVARDRVYGSRAAVVQAQSSPLELEEIDEMTSGTPGIDAVLDRKFAADRSLSIKPQAFADYKRENLSDYFRGSSELERLAQQYPSLHADILRAAEIVFTGLARSIAESDERPLIVVRGIREQLESILREEVPGLGRDLSLLLARYYVASWWVQCPLQFEEISA